jgi:putative ABC transport system permease protein
VGRAIVATDNPALDTQIWMTLARAQHLADTPGAATEILAFADRRADAAGLARAIRAEIDDEALAVEVWSERDPFAGVLQVIDVVRALLMALVTAIAALAVWNTTTMAALERTAEIGVLRALGMSRTGCVGLLVGEAWACAALGGTVGTGVGCAAAVVLAVRGIELGGRVTANLGVPLASRIHAVLTPEVPAWAWVLALTMATLGALPAAVRAARLLPVVAISGRR